MGRKRVRVEAREDVEAAAARGAQAVVGGRGSGRVRKPSYKAAAAAAGASSAATVSNNAAAGVNLDDDLVALTAVGSDDSELLNELDEDVKAYGFYPPSDNDDDQYEDEDEDDDGGRDDDDEGNVLKYGEPETEAAETEPSATSRRRADMPMGPPDAPSGVQDTSGSGDEVGVAVVREPTARARAKQLDVAQAMAVVAAAAATAAVSGQQGALLNPAPLLVRRAAGVSPLSPTAMAAIRAVMDVFHALLRDSPASHEEAAFVLGGYYQETLRYLAEVDDDVANRVHSTGAPVAPRRGQTQRSHRA
jgi:hypothetical protein